MLRWSSRRARDLPGQDAIAFGPAPQPRGRTPSPGDASFPFRRFSHTRRGPSDRLSPFPVRAVFSCGVETRWLWSSLTLPICRYCLWAQRAGGRWLGLNWVRHSNPPAAKKRQIAAVFCHNLIRADRNRHKINLNSGETTDLTPAPKARLAGTGG